MVANDITGKVIGCAMKVHSTLKHGFQEKIYQRALAIELQETGISFECEKEMNVLYKGEIIGLRRLDFIVENQILIELKALSAIEDSHIVQAKNYLQIFGLKTGLLINFGAKSLEFKRIFPNG